MRYLRGSADFQVNWIAFQDMDEHIPMTRPERTALRNWALAGHDIETNPWNYTDGDGWPLNFLQAYRLKIGYSSGPWDYWKGPENQPFWDEIRRCFIPEDDLVD